MTLNCDLLKVPVFGNEYEGCLRMCQGCLQMVIRNGYIFCTSCPEEWFISSMGTEGPKGSLMGVAYWEGY